MFEFQFSFLLIWGNNLGSQIVEWIQITLDMLFVTLFCSLLNMKKELSSVYLFIFFNGYFLKLRKEKKIIPLKKLLKFDKYAGLEIILKRLKLWHLISNLMPKAV